MLLRSCHSLTIRSASCSMNSTDSISALSLICPDSTIKVFHSSSVMMDGGTTGAVRDLIISVTVKVLMIFGGAVMSVGIVKLGRSTGSASDANSGKGSAPVRVSTIPEIMFCISSNSTGVMSEGGFNKVSISSGLTDVFPDITNGTCPYNLEKKSSRSTADSAASTSSLMLPGTWNLAISSGVGGIGSCSASVNALRNLNGPDTGLPTRDSWSDSFLNST